ncbi:MAG: glycoside hydrolase [Hyphomicrobiales bacterium]|nr:MAG: glycoside hydrolase [Hyphomicrobiales bacterium]
MKAFDRRLVPARPDLAAEHLRGTVTADRYAVGETLRVVADATPMRPEPRADRSIDTELLFGETVTIYDRTPEGWVWGQAGTDEYVGWLPADALGPFAPEPTHRVAVLRTYRYPMAELKLPPRGLISMGSRVTVVSTQTVRDLEYAILPDGSAVAAKHLVPLDHKADDWVAVAESFVGTPYRWGGRTSFGLDCSALVQLAAAEAGIAAPRDSDMQEAGFGDQLDISAGLPSLQRGDLVFWKGHVGIMLDDTRLLHASGFFMAVAIEPLDDAVTRIAASGSPVTAVRRL